MLQLLANFLFHLETGKERWIALALQQRHFDRDNFSGICIDRFINGSHAASIDDIENLKSVVERLANIHVI